MQRNWLDEFKGAFRKSNNGLIQLILINGIVFFFFCIMEVVLVLTGVFAENFSYHQAYLSILVLPADLG